jgi:hypothetical protein
MKKEIFFIACLTLIVVSLRSQDIIRFKNGDSIQCKISKIDSTNIYFDIDWNKKNLFTFIERDSVQSYDYNYAIPKKLKSPKDNNFLISIDPMGIFALGPSATLEFLFQEKNSSVGFGFYAGCSLINLGLISSKVMGDYRAKISYGLPLAVRIYPISRTNSDGLLIGMKYEFGKYNFTGGSQTKIRSFGIEMGYRWVFNNGFTIELADVIGLIQTKQITATLGTDTQIHSETDWKSNGIAPLMLSLKLGYAFK